MFSVLYARRGGETGEIFRVPLLLVFLLGLPIFGLRGREVI